MKESDHQKSQIDSITISKREYKALIEDVKFLRALQAAGVDNWEGYNIAVDIAIENQ